MRRVAKAGVVALASLPLLLAACSPADEDAPVIVFAAASTVEVVDRVVEHVQSQSPGTDIAVTYGGSADLAAQINEGAPAAVFLSANEASMATVTDEPRVGEPQVFATNSLTIVVPTGNPGGVTG